MEYPNLDNFGSPDFCPLSSASFRHNEEFQKIFSALRKCASFWCRIEHENGSFWLSGNHEGSSARSVVNSWFDSAFSSLRALDRQFLRAEEMRINRDRMAQCIELEINLGLIENVRTVEKIFNDNAEFLLSPDSRPLLWFGFLGCATLPEFSPYDNYTVQYFLDTVFRALFEAGHELACNIIVSVVVLSIVYRYLLGYVDRGGTKTYNPGSIEFRDTFVSLLLFRGAYVWIKFRDVYPPGVRPVPKRDEFNKVIKGEYYDKYESRLKPPNQRDYLHLGVYDKVEHAVLVRRIGLFYYKKDGREVTLEDGREVTLEDGREVTLEDGREVTLEDGSLYPIPKMSEKERSLCREEKRKWVQQQANAVYKEIQEKNKKIREENASRRPPSEDRVEALGSSSSADQSGIALLAQAFNAYSEGLSTIGEMHGPPESGDGGTPDYFTIDEIATIFSVVPLPQEIVELNEQLAEERQKVLRLEEENSGLKEENSRLRQEISDLQQPQNKRLKSA